MGGMFVCAGDVSLIALTYLYLQAMKYLLDRYNQHVNTATIRIVELTGMKDLKTVTDLLVNGLGSHKVTADRDILGQYARDETSDLEAYPDLVVRVDSAADVSLTMRICNDYRIPLTPRGAGTGVTGGAVAVNGGVLMSLERLNRILEIDGENMVAVVEPGAITGTIQKAAAARGLMYPPDPASLDNCSIGGNVAENAGGPRALKYGTTRDYVLGIEYVLPDGSIISTGGKMVKNVTGYSTMGIIIGSEGTLAVITKIILKLMPAPACARDLLIPCHSLDEAMGYVHRILQERIVPATIEFMEQDAIDLVARHLGAAMPLADAGAHLLIQLDGNSIDVIHADLLRIAGLVDVDKERILVAESARQSERIWRARRSIRDALRAESPVFLAEDSVVPRASIPHFLKKIKGHLLSRGLRSIMFGHAGDGNVHIDVLKGELDYNEWRKMLPEIRTTIYQHAIACGGTITGEHGIGYIRREYLPLAVSAAEIALYRRIKNAFDPNMILNPGKIFS